LSLLVVIILATLFAVILAWIKMRPLQPQQRQTREIVDLPDEPNKELLGIIRSRKKILAIKRARELYGLGLAEAKQYVDKLEHELI
jgi:ribosomal protein L7/L12